MYLYGENAEKIFSANVLKTKAEIYNVSELFKLFSYNQNFVPWGLCALVPGLKTCIKLCNFEMSSSLKPLAIFTRFNMGPSVERILTISSYGSTPLNKMAAMPICGKNT